MKRFRTSLAAKTAAVLLALAVGAGGFWSTVFILYQWDTLWLGSGYYDLSLIHISEPTRPY